MKYFAVKELKSPTKVNRWLYLFDLIFIIVYNVAFGCFKNIIHPSFKVPYYIFTGICSVILTMPSPYNPQKRIFQSLIFYLTRNRVMYYPIDYPKKQKGDIKRWKYYKEQR